MSCTAKRTDFNEATESDNSAESSLPTTTSSATISDNTGNPSFILGNHDIREYALVTENEKDSAAKLVVNYFIRIAGVEIPIIPISTYRQGPAIFFGCAKADGSHLNNGLYGSSQYFITEIEDNIIIDFKTSEASLTAAVRFINECEQKVGEKISKVSFSGDGTVTGIYINDYISPIVLNNKTSEQIKNGILYEELLYFDSQKKPIRAYSLTIEPGMATIATSMPNDANEIGTVSDILQQITAAEKNGKKVLAGVNADFFNMGGNNKMQGLCIKDGVLLNAHNGKPWFGFTKDGKSVVGDVWEYALYADKLTSAVGGSHILLKDGEIYRDLDTATRAPRTAIGIKSDGSTVLLVIDGRQPKISNGVTIAELTDILVSLGCSDAINLDGGGSSTFVLKNEDGEFSVKNSPSDGSLRPVANGLMVLLP